MKLSSLVDQSNYPEFSEKIISETKLNLKKEFEKIDDFKIPKFPMVLSITSKMAVPITAIFVLVSLVAFIFLENLTLGEIMAGVAAFFLILSIILLKKFSTKSSNVYHVESEKRNSWENAILKNLVHDKLIKKLIEDKYENVEVITDRNSKKEDIDFVFLKWKSSVPHEAKLTKYEVGLSFRLNGHLVKTIGLHWQWEEERYDKKTKKYYKIVVSKHNSFIFSHEFNKRFNEFELSLYQSGSVNGELENDAFNQKYSYEHNNPIMLRVVLSPFVQETLTNEISKCPYTRFWKEKNAWCLESGLVGPTLVPKIKLAHNPKSPEELIDVAVNSVVSDADCCINILAFLATLREMFKKETEY